MEKKISHKHWVDSKGVETTVVTHSEYDKSTSSWTDQEVTLCKKPLSDPLALNDECIKYEKKTRPADITEPDKKLEE